MEAVDFTQPGLDVEKFKKASSGVNETPFVWQNSSQEYNMKLLSGFAGATMTDAGFIKAQMGWAIAEQIEKAEGSDQE